MHSSGIHALAIIYLGSSSHKQSFNSSIIIYQDTSSCNIPTLSFIMVYPKHQTLPPSPHKKARTAANTSSYSLATDKMNTTSPPSSNVSTPSDSSSDSQEDTVSIIFDMMKNYNTMIEMHQTSIKIIEDGGEMIVMSLFCWYIFSLPEAGKD